MYRLVMVSFSCFLVGILIGLLANIGSHPKLDVSPADNAICKVGGKSFSFDSEPFVNPKIIQDLMCDFKEYGDEVVAINLLDALESYRYSSEQEVVYDLNENANPYVNYYPEHGFFGYRYVGKSSTGVHVLLIRENGGGSGTFYSLLFLKVESDQGIIVDWAKNEIVVGKSRVLLRKLGQMILGDRYKGKIEVVGNRLFIGKNTGWFSDFSGKELLPHLESDHLFRLNFD